jgi:hypothetical protein
MESGRLARPCPCLRIIVVHTRFAYPAIAPAQSPLPGHAHNLPSPLPQNPVFSAVAAHHVSSAESPPPGRHRRPHSAPAISVRFGNTGWRGFCHSKTEPNISVDPVTPSLGMCRANPVTPNLPCGLGTAPSPPHRHPCSRLAQDGARPTNHARSCSRAVAGCTGAQASPRPSRQICQCREPGVLDALRSVLTV